MFARFEFAMKRCPEFRANGDLAKADWKAFANSKNISPLIGKLKSDARLTELIQKPPKQFVVVKGQVVPGPQPDPCADMDSVCLALKTARNNLFHGEKGQVVAPREHDLLADGIIILDEMLQAEPKVLQYYYF